MMAFTVFVVIYVKLRNVPLSVFPKQFTKRYWILTMIVVLLFVTAPDNYIKGFPAVLVLVYGSIVTPIYEELLFRGYFWNRMSTVIKNDYDILIINALLFSLWHLGYVLPNLLSGNMFAVTTKLLIGFSYGLLLGFVRVKTKNCYSAIVLHGILNIFL